MPGSCRAFSSKLLPITVIPRLPASSSYKRFRKMVYDMLYGSYKVYDTGKNSGLFDLYLDLTAGTIVDLIVLWLNRDDMSYDEFLSST